MAHDDRIIIATGVCMLAVALVGVLGVYLVLRYFHNSPSGLIHAHHRPGGYSVSIHFEALAFLVFVASQEDFAAARGRCFEWQLLGVNIPRRRKRESVAGIVGRGTSAKAPRRHENLSSTRDASPPPNGKQTWCASASKCTQTQPQGTRAGVLRCVSTHVLMHVCACVRVCSSIALKRMRFLAAGLKNPLQRVCDV